MAHKRQIKIILQQPKRLKIIDKIPQKSTDNKSPLQHYFQHPRRHTKGSRNLQSLCSIEHKRSQIILIQKSNYMKRRNMHTIDSQIISTDRKNSEIQNNEQKQKNTIPFPYKVNFIDTTSLEEKENQIKNCINKMQDALHQIEIQKSQRKILKQKNNDDSNIMDNKPPNKHSNFQNYVKNITKIKNDSRPILIKRGHSKSIINIEGNPAMRSILGSSRGQSRKLSNRNIIKISSSKQINQLHKNTIIEQMKQQIKIQQKKQQKNNEFQMKSIDCSKIQMINQSSFISNTSKNILEQLILKKDKIEQNKQTIESKKSLIIKSKKLKNIFPDGFFC